MTSQLTYAIAEEPPGTVAAPIVGTSAGVDAISDPNSRRLLEIAIRKPGNLFSPVLSRDGRRLVYSSHGRRDFSSYALALKTKSPPGETKLGTFNGSNEGIVPGTGNALSPDGRIFANGRRGEAVDPRSNSIQLWDTRSWKKIGVLKGHPHTVVSIVFSRDGKRVISGNAGGGVIIHDLATRRIVSAWCRGLCYSAYAAFWEMAGETVPIAIVRANTNYWCTAPKAIDGCTFAPPTGAGNFEIWNLATNTKIKDLKLPRPSVAFAPDLAVSADGHLLAFLTMSRQEANRSGNPYYVTVVDWQKEKILESKIEDNLFVNFGYWNTLQFLANQRAVLLADAANDRVAVIDIKPLDASLPH